jgi:hypothetical protein
MKAPEIQLGKTSLFSVRRTRLTERRDPMRRITYALVVLATTASVALVAVALPLAAIASNGGPGA